MEVGNMVKVSLLGAMGFIFMFIFKIPFPFIPFIDFDFSDVPAIIGAIIIGPIHGVIIQLIKNLLHISTTTTTIGVGEIANFVMGSFLVYPVGLIMKDKKTMKNLIIGLMVGTITLSAIACVLNYFVLIPLYGELMYSSDGTGVDAIIDIVSANNKYVDSKIDIIIYGVLPANIIKGAVVSLISILLFKFLKEPIIKLSKIL